MIFFDAAYPIKKKKKIYAIVSLYFHVLEKAPFYLPKPEVCMK